MITIAQIGWPYILIYIIGLIISRIFFEEISGTSSHRFNKDDNSLLVYTLFWFIFIPVYLLKWIGYILALLFSIIPKFLERFES